RSRRHRRRGLEHELAVGRVGTDDRTVAELAREHLYRKRVLELALDRPLERARAVGRVVSVLDQELGRRIAQLERDPPVSQPPPQALDLEAHDLAELVAVEPLEVND